MAHDLALQKSTGVVDGDMERERVHHKREIKETRFDDTRIPWATNLVA
jgi:hypothetical protein